jgi:signal peptidase II
MAWGTEILEPTVNYFFALRLVAVGGIGYWLWDSVERKRQFKLFVAVALILILAERSVT